MATLEHRPRNAAATREAILESAIRNFARAGYDGVGVREIARDTAVSLIARTDPASDALEPFLITLRSVSNPRAVEIVRAAIERHVGKRLARQLPEPGRQLRTEVILSVIAGTLLMRRLIATRALNETDPDQLASVLEEVFAAVIESPMA